MCAIVGLFGQTPVNQAIYDALTVLQHRGQDAAGIVTLDGNKLCMRKNNGLVRDVFRTRHMMYLRGNIGLGHVRYPTAGCSSSEEAQPFYVNSPFGITLAHNGNLTNADVLREEIRNQDHRHLNTNSDTEVLLNIFAHELDKFGKRSITPDEIFTAISQVHKRCKGGYAVISLIMGHGLVAFRDPHSIRPLVFGKRQAANGEFEYMVASESVALDSLGFDLIRDVGPGEGVYIDLKGNLHVQSCAEDTVATPCIFEYVYLARPDSVIDNISVYKARLRMGQKLGEKILRERPDHDIDVVIPIPDTSRTSALELSNVLGVTLREGFIKNRYIGRTFIMPGQGMRKRSIRKKLNAIELEFKDKNVLLVDDSIVRGNTSEQIIQMARDAGAKNVYFASAAPPVRHPNVYGIDMPAASELVAHNRNEQEICDEIGADWLIYQDLPDLIDAVSNNSSYISQFDTSCFSGEYITGDVTSDYLIDLEKSRSDAAKQQQDEQDDDEEEIKSYGFG